MSLNTDKLNRVPMAPNPAEEWWRELAAKIAAKMQHGGVRKFSVERNANGNFDFEAVPEEEKNRLTVKR